MRSKYDEQSSDERAEYPEGYSLKAALGLQLSFSSLDLRYSKPNCANLFIVYVG